MQIIFARKLTINKKTKQVVDMHDKCAEVDFGKINFERVFKFFYGVSPKRFIDDFKAEIGDVTHPATKT